MYILKKIIRNIIILPLYMWQVFFIFLPLLILGYREWNNFAEIIENIHWLLKSHFVFITLYSFIYAFIVTIFALVLGYMFSYIITSWSYIAQMICLLFASIPFLSNFLIHATSWVCFLENNGVLHTLLKKCGLDIEKTSFLYNKYATIAVLVYCYLPYAILPLYISLEKFDRRLLRASKDLGATPTQTFFKIVVPSTENALVTAFFLVFIPCTSEFIIPQIIGGDRILYCGSVFSYITMTPKLFALAPTTTVFYIIMLLLTSLILLFGIKKCIRSL